MLNVSRKHTQFLIYIFMQLEQLSFPDYTLGLTFFQLFWHANERYRFCTYQRNL